MSNSLLFAWTFVNDLNRLFRKMAVRPHSHTQTHMVLWYSDLKSDKRLQLTFLYVHNLDSAKHLAEIGLGCKASCIIWSRKRRPLLKIWTIITSVTRTQLMTVLLTVSCCYRGSTRHSKPTPVCLSVSLPPDLSLALWAWWELPK